VNLSLSEELINSLNASIEKEDRKQINFYCIELTAHKLMAASAVKLMVGLVKLPSLRPKISGRAAGGNDDQQCSRSGGTAGELVQLRMNWEESSSSISGLMLAITARLGLATIAPACRHRRPITAGKCYRTTTTLPGGCRVSVSMDQLMPARSVMRRTER